MKKKKKRNKIIIKFNVALATFKNLLKMEVLKERLNEMGME